MGFWVSKSGWLLGRESTYYYCSVHSFLILAIQSLAATSKEQALYLINLKLFLTSFLSLFCYYPEICLSTLVSPFPDLYAYFTLPYVKFWLRKKNQWALLWQRTYYQYSQGITAETECKYNLIIWTVDNRDIWHLIPFDASEIMIIFVTIYSTVHMAVFNYTCWNNPLSQGQVSSDYMLCCYFLVVIYPWQLLSTAFDFS